MWTTDGLQTESDVEQKFIFPFLTEAEPLGLGLPSAVVLTKANIRRFAIGKGTERKSYFPDYLVVELGFPLLVIEAKSPAESVEDGFREARLYATEINALYRHGFSPAKFVMATNGIDLWYGNSDSATPLGTAPCATLGAYSPIVAEITRLMSWKHIRSLAVRFAQQSRPEELYKPRRLIGGVAVQNEEVGTNTFGASLTALISPAFNPGSPKERAEVARDAYISSKRRERYVDPIDRVIRAARPPSETQSRLIEDTEKPTEILSRLKEPKSLEHKILLLIGSVGSGKSTFIDHLIEVALPTELMKATVWCRIDMNPAPVTAREIYGWLRREIIRGCRASLPDLDFDDIEVLRKLFGTEIARFKKGVGRLYEGQQNVYELKLGELMEGLLKDEHALAGAHVRFTCAERGKLLIVVLDNCDKKTRDEQLLMFEAAQWLQKEFRCLVVLPLRDETYDNHRNQPPLDTALKDLVFRIEPPLFQQVLFRRVQFALKKLTAAGSEKLHFSLPNGFVVEYPKTEQAYYLTAIMKSLFEHDRFARRMIVGLSGRNMRRALEIFLEFCNSGHIGEDHIFKMRQSEGNYTLPLHQVATVLLRMNRRFYDSDNSYIKNLFSASKDDPLPAYFCRYMILRWLRAGFSSAGTAGLRGYFRKGVVKHALMPYGLDPDVLDREFNYLLAAQCLIAEHLRLDSVDDSDLVRLGPAGFVHLELLGNVNYLAAIAEDTWFADRLQAERVANRIRSMDSHLRPLTVTENADEVVSYLEMVNRTAVPPPGSLIEGNEAEQLTDLRIARDAIDRIAKAHGSDPWFSAERRLSRGSKHTATVINGVQYGYFAQLDDGLVGLAHWRDGGLSKAEVGDRVEVEILWVDAVEKRIGLRIVAIVEEDAGDVVVGAHGALEISDDADHPVE